MKGAYRDEIEWWHKEFCEGLLLAEFIPHERTPSVCAEETIITVVVIIREDRQLSLFKMEEQTNILKSTLHRILKDHLKMRRIASTCVPRCLTREQM